MFGLFGSKDWNVLAVIFERQDLFQVSGQRAKGGNAKKAKDGAQGHARTIFWAVFNQKGTFVEGGPGAGAKSVSPEIVKRLERELRTTKTVQDILKMLETGESERTAKPLVWGGYPRKQVLKPEEEF